MGKSNLWGVSSSVVNIFENAFTKECKEVIVNDEITIKEVLCRAGYTEYDHIICFVNGKKQDLYYELQKDDICTVRIFPAATAIFVLGVIAGLYGIAEAISWGTTGRCLFDNIKLALRDWLTPDQDDVKSQEQQKQLPTISGCKNQSALGKPIPLILGTTRFTPYYIGRPYNSISTNDDGKTEYFHALYLLGYNDIRLDGVKLGTFPLCSTPTDQDGALVIDESIYPSSIYETQLELQQGAHEVGLYPQKVVQTNYGNELIHEPNVNAIVNYGFSAKYPQRVEIEFSVPTCIAYSDKGDRRNNTINVGIAMSIDGGQTWQPAIGNAPRANSVYTEEVNGVNYRILSYTRCSSETMRFIFVMSGFSYEWAEAVKNHVIEFKIIRESIKSTDTKVQGQVYLSRVRTWCYDRTKSEETGDFVAQTPMIEKYRDKTARLGFCIKAGELINNDMDEVSCVVSSKARVWDSENEEWSQTTEVTDNPASLALLALTGSYRGFYAYSDNKIDLQSFGQFYEWCQADFDFGNGGVMQRFTCDGALTSKKKTLEVVNAILQCGRGQLKFTGSKYGVLFDAPRTDDMTVEGELRPTLILNNQNVLEASNTKAFADLPDGYQTKFINAILDYQEDTFTSVPVGKDPNNPDLKLESKEYLFHTNPYRVKARALYELACQKYRPEVWNRKVGLEGNLIEVGNLIELQDDTLAVGIGDGAEIIGLSYADNAITEIKTDGRFTVTDSSLDYGIKIMQADGINEPKVIKARVVVSEAGVYSDLVLETPIPVSVGTIQPTVGDIVSFGLFDRITTYAICVSKKGNSDGTFNLTLYPYDNHVYTADDGLVDDFDSKVTPPQVSGVPIGDITVPVTIDQVYDAMKIVRDGSPSMIPADVISLEALAEEDGIRFIPRVQATSSIPETATSFIYQIKKPNGEWTDVSTKNNFYYFDRTNDGYPEKVTNGGNLDNWQFRVKGVNLYGNTSENWVSTYVDTTNYATWIPTTPVIAEPRVSQRNITLYFAQSAKVYGNIKYRVSVSRYDEILNNVRYYNAPNLQADPYEDEFNYRDMDNPDGFIVSDSVYSQTMPLECESAEYHALEVKKDDESELENLMVVPDANNIEPLMVSALASASKDTTYFWKIQGYNTVSQSASTGYAYTQATALATSVKDIVDNAIMENKIATNAVSGEKIQAEAVTAEKIHAGAVTADKLFARNINTIGLFVGNIDGVQRDDKGNLLGTPNNFWHGLDTEEPEFRIGNDYQKELDGDDDAEYIHYIPTTGRYGKLVLVYSYDDEHYYSDAECTTEVKIPKNVKLEKTAESKITIDDEEVTLVQYGYRSTTKSYTAGMYFKVANFIVTAVSSIIRGLFKIRGKQNGNEFIKVNPETSRNVDESINGETMEINGDVIIGKKYDGETDGKITSPKVEATAGSFGSVSVTNNVESQKVIPSQGVDFNECNTNGVKLNTKVNINRVCFDAQTSSLYLWSN